MSWQAMGAVQAALSFVDPQKSVGFRILLAIAWYANAQGVAGRPGQPRACPTQLAIAARARLHVSTVARWLPRLEEAGELAVERRGADKGEQPRPPRRRQHQPPGPASAPGAPGRAQIAFQGFMRQEAARNGVDHR